MYAAVDIGGTKTLIAVFSKAGKVIESFKFPTPSDYREFIKECQKQLATHLHNSEFLAAAVAAPGRIDRKEGVGITFGNLPWKRVHLQEDFEKMLHCPVIVENDSKLAALSEAILIKNEFKNVLYVTISTGISAGLVVDGMIDPEFADSESGHMLLEHNGKLETWESFASGKAIVAQYGKRASELNDKTAWVKIAHAMTLGMINLIAIIQPDIILIGGGVGTHFNKFGDLLKKELKKYEMPLVPIPPIRKAKRPEEAVIYGCFDLVKATYGKLDS